MAAKKKVAQNKSQKVKASTTDAPSGTYTQHGLQLAILDRGFIYVGDVTTNSEWCVILNARNVRSWGTKEGLGELALKGPLPNTQLDDTGTVRAPLKSLIALIACDQSKWKS
jgi:hypothetical protein